MSKRDQMTKTNGSLNRSPLHLLHRVGQCADELLLAEVGDASLTARQLAVLMTVEEHQGISQTGIVENGD